MYLIIEVVGFVALCLLLPAYFISTFRRIRKCTT